MSRSTLRLRRAADAATFRALAGTYLLAREDAHNLVLGLVPSAPYRAVVLDGHEVVAAAVRVPPSVALLSQVTDLRAVDLLADDLAGDPLPGVAGPPEAARRFAERLGGPRALQEAIVYRADAVVPPTGVAGAPRTVTPADRELLVEWCGAFLAAAVPHQRDDPAAAADLCLAEPDGTWVWVDRGVPVTLARYGNPTPSSVRISLVYTPDAHRGRGYASALVAAMTRHLLDAGWAFTTLLADRANPVATRIYRRMGYAPVADSHTWWFTGT